MDQRLGFELFQKYIGLLAQDLSDEERLLAAKQSLRELTAELSKAHFAVHDLRKVAKAAGVTVDGRKEMVVMICHDLLLVPLPPANQTPLGRAQAITIVKRYGWKTKREGSIYDPHILFEEFVERYREDKNDPELVDVETLLARMGYAVKIQFGNLVEDEASADTPPRQVAKITLINPQGQEETDVIIDDGENSGPLTNIITAEDRKFLDAYYFRIE